MICNVFLSTSTIMPFTFKIHRFLKKRPAAKVYFPFHIILIFSAFTSALPAV